MDSSPSPLSTIPVKIVGSVVIPEKIVGSVVGTASLGTAKDSYLSLNSVGSDVGTLKIPTEDESLYSVGSDVGVMK